MIMKRPAINPPREDARQGCGRPLEIAQSPGGGAAGRGRPAKRSERAKVSFPLVVLTAKKIRVIGTCSVKLETLDALAFSGVF